MLGGLVMTAQHSRFGGTFAGVIEDLSSCEHPAIRHISATKEESGTKDKSGWEPLNSQDLYRPLAAGDRIRCTGKGAIVVTGLKRPVTDDPKGIVLNADAEAEALLYDLKGFIRAGGRGEEQVIRFPAREARLAARDFVIIWQPPPGTGEVTLSVVSPATGETLCCRSPLNGARSRIESPEAVSELIKARSAQPPDSRFVLRVAAAEVGEITVPFSILSASEEAQLQSELDEWTSAGPLLQHLGRAHVFRNWQLSAREAEEVEFALKESPDSPYLRALCLQAEDRANNTARVRELSRRR